MAVRRGGIHCRQREIDNPEGRRSCEPSENLEEAAAHVGSVTVRIANMSAS